MSLGKGRRRLKGCREGAVYLSGTDPKLKSLVKKVGAPAMFYHPERSVFEALATAIAYQQLHGKAAETILNRFKSLFPAEFPEPGDVLKADANDLLKCGLSRSKAGAIRDLAAKVLDGTVPDRDAARRMSNDELVERITQVKGIGRWTVEMFLIFTLGRPDILPVHDYGVRKGYAVAFGKRKLPTPRQLEKLGTKFSPHRSLLAWYLWRACELGSVGGT